ncbi:hypothetical protein TYRP_001004 [Tyrophagus putrescentiae]|nr:hypothetical protein TYRP_001004 [Tyrophagus putrescentiae]
MHDAFLVWDVVVVVVVIPLWS